jgi:hypothetical protein
MIIACLVIALLLSGCTPAVPPPATTTPAPVTATPVRPTATHTQTSQIETPLPSDTDMPTDTPTVTETSTQSDTPVPSETPVPSQTGTPTSTPLPTLLPGEAKALIYELLQTNGGCELPCWWGITPGETTWKDTYNLISLMRATSNTSISLSDGRVFHGTGGFDWYPERIFNRISFYERDGIVDGIYIRVEGYKDPSFFYKLWKNYSPVQIISTYGQPTQIRFNIFYYGFDVPFSYLWMIYENQGFFVRYYSRALSQVNENGLTYLVCPTWQDIVWEPTLELYMQSPYHPTPLEDSIKHLKNVNQLPGKSIEDAAGISVEEFYELFLPGGEPACFESLQSIWE